MGMFDYTALDETSLVQQDFFKQSCESLTNEITKRVTSPRAKSLALAAVEQVYLWSMKAVAADQEVRVNDPLKRMRGDE